MVATCHDIAETVPTSRKPEKVFLINNLVIRTPTQSVPLGLLTHQCGGFHPHFQKA
jgi:hypothetical protein